MITVVWFVALMVVGITGMAGFALTRWTAALRTITEAENVVGRLDALADRLSPQGTHPKDRTP